MPLLHDLEGAGLFEELLRGELRQLLDNMVKEELTDTQTRQAFFDNVYNAAKAAGIKPTTP